MARNGSGTYSLPQSAFVAGTVISSAAVNSNFSDIATALTNSVCVDGQSPISGQLKGTQSASITYSFTGDTGTGFGSTVIGEADIYVSSTKIAAFTSTGLAITGLLSATTTLSVTGASTLTGNTTVGGTLGVTGVATLTAIPVFSAGIGSATATTQATTDSSTKVATTAFVQNNKPAAPTVQTFLSGAAATYTPTAGFVRIRVRMCGGGGGGGAVASNNGTVGNDTSFGTWTAIHGNGGAAAGGTPGAGGTGGTDGTGTKIVRLAGSAGNGGRTDAGGGSTTYGYAGGEGGCNAFGGRGGGVVNAAGGNAPANTGGGGAGGGNTSTQVATGSGGGAGEYVEFWMTAAQVGASQTYTVGAAANGGAAGTHAGGNGAAGIIIIEEFYS